MSKSTVNALLARSFDSLLATSLASKGYTIASLKQLKAPALRQLGIPDDQVSNLLSESRPPVPDSTLLRVLYKNRRTCCVCRNAALPIVVHHIDEWSKSRSHDESNLAVLCLPHHDLAHTSKLLSQGLSPSELSEAKRRWEHDVLTLDAKSILRLKQDNDWARWDWINLHRVSELALKRGIQCRDTRVTTLLRSLGIINALGALTEEATWRTDAKPSQWFLQFREGYIVAHYLSDIIDQVLESLPLIDITSHIKSRPELRSLISEGDYIAAQLPFYFRDEEPFQSYKSQRRRAYYRGHSVRIEYVFDAWHCTSSSARFDAMTGRKVQTIFGLVRSVVLEEDEIQINLSCLAAGTAFDAHRARAA